MDKKNRAYPQPRSILLWWELAEQYKFLWLNGLRIRSKALPVVAATMYGIALRIADIAEFKPRGRVDGQIGKF